MKFVIAPCADTDPQVTLRARVWVEMMWASISMISFWVTLRARVWVEILF